MATQVIVNSKTQTQSPQVWDKPSESAAEHQLGLINPSRCITAQDEIFLRDYTLAASVISWDSGTFGTSLQVAAGDITNIAITGDTVWYQINLHSAIPLDIETFHAHRLRIEAHYSEQNAAEEECQQPAGEGGDSVRSSLQPTEAAHREFDTGRIHGQHDARAKLHPIYNQATCNYSSGYMEGYNSVLNPQGQPEIVKRVEWSVRYNAKWGWYEAWVGSRCCIDKGASYSEAERIAQRQLSIEETIKRQNRAVMAAYAW